MGMYDDALLGALKSGAEAAAPNWGLSPRTTVSLLNISENATYRADDPDADAPIILRVHRPGYHTRAEIESELAWIDSLRAEGVVQTPEPLTTTDGNRLVSFTHEGEDRYIAAFSFMSGEEPKPDADLAGGFHTLGAISAKLHAHTRVWTRPASFVRKTWSFETTLGATPHWGPWRAAMGLGADGAAVLGRLCDVLEKRLAAFGADAERFGLIHADLRLANLLVEGDRLGVIDFDDCGFGWFMYDFAAAISFIEEDPIIPDLRAAWIDGHRTIAPLGEEDVAEIDSFVMLRRLLLTAWLASHSETPTAQELGADYTDGTLRLADAYLSNHG